MTLKLRLSLLVFALLLTGLALGPTAQAGECTLGQNGWIYFGSCCPFLDTIQLLRARCSDEGYWEIVTPMSYKCPPEACQ